MIRKTLYLLAVFYLSSYVLAMEEWEPALTTVTTVPFAHEEAQPSLLEELSVELLKMIYDKLDPNSKNAFLRLNKRFFEMRYASRSVTLKDEAGILCLSSRPELEALKIACELSPQSIVQLKLRLSGLRILDLSENKLWAEDLAFLLPSLTNLQQLSLRDCGVQRVDSGYMASLALLLLGRKCASENLSYLAGLTQLRRLDLNSCNHVTNASLRYVAGLTLLQQLDLSRTLINDVGLAHVSKLALLRQLALSSTSVSDVGIRHLAGLTQLQELEVLDIQVSDIGLQYLRELTQLRKLIICWHISNAAALQAALPNLVITR